MSTAKLLGSTKPCQQNRAVNFYQTVARSVEPDPPFHQTTAGFTDSTALPTNLLFQPTATASKRGEKPAANTVKLTETLELFHLFSSPCLSLGRGACRFGSATLRFTRPLRCQALPPDLHQHWAEGGHRDLYGTSSVFELWMGTADTNLHWQFQRTFYPCNIALVTPILLSSGCYQRLYSNLRFQILRGDFLALTFWRGRHHASSCMLVLLFMPAKRLLFTQLHRLTQEKLYDEDGQAGKTLFSSSRSPA